MFSSSHSVHPRRQKRPPILLRFSLLTISSGDLFFFIVPAISCRTQHFSSPSREVSLFFPFWLSHLCVLVQMWGLNCLMPFEMLIVGIGRRGHPVDNTGKRAWSSRGFGAPGREWAPQKTDTTLNANCTEGPPLPEGKSPAHREAPSRASLGRVNYVTDYGHVCIYPQVPIQKQRMVGRGGRNEFSAFSPIGPLSFPWDISCLYWKNKACKHRPNETRII